MKVMLLACTLIFTNQMHASNDYIAGQLLTSDVDLEALAWECYDTGEFTLEITEQIIAHLPTEPVEANGATCYNLYTFYA